MFRSDVIGSLLRPAYLKEARERYELGQLTSQAFKQIEDAAVDEAVALQTRAGVEVLTDGEMRRYAFYGHLIDAVEGFDKFGGWTMPFRNEQGEQLPLERPVVVERLRRKRHLCAEEFTYLRAGASHLAKVTFISAQQAAAYYDGKKSCDAYPKMENYLADVVDILRGEVEELILCRGNHRSAFYSAGDYSPIAKVFSQTRFNRFLLEYDDERSGGFEPLAQVPEDRTIVLGLVTSKKPALESKDEPKRRIEAASAFAPLDRLALSSQCGFASTLEGNLLSPEDQEAKLRLVAETAREVWG